MRAERAKAAAGAVAAQTTTENVAGERPVEISAGVLAAASAPARVVAPLAGRRGQMAKKQAEEDGRGGPAIRHRRDAEQSQDSPRRHRRPRPLELALGLGGGTPEDSAKQQQAPAAAELAGADRRRRQVCAGHLERVHAVGADAVHRAARGARRLPREHGAAQHIARGAHVLGEAVARVTVVRTPPVAGAAERARTIRCGRASAVCPDKAGVAHAATAVASPMPGAGVRATAIVRGGANIACGTLEAVATNAAAIALAFTVPAAR